MIRGLALLAALVFVGSVIGFLFVDHRLEARYLHACESSLEVLNKDRCAQLVTEGRVCSDGALVDGMSLFECVSRSRLESGILGLALLAIISCIVGICSAAALLVRRKNRRRPAATSPHSNAPSN